MFRVGTDFYVAPRGLHWLGERAHRITDARVRAFVILRLLVPVSRRTVTNMAQRV